MADYGIITQDSVAGPTGAPLDLRPWQRRLYGATFARDPRSGRRRHRTALWGMGRKNGKTSSVAPIALRALMLEGQGSQIYSCAADREQARIVFGTAVRTVELTDLAERLRIYRTSHTIEDPRTGSIYRALSAEAYTKEGLNPTLVIADELHAWPSRELYDVMALAMGTRVDPLMLIVTTAGVRTDSTGQDSIAYTLYQYGRRVAALEIDDPSFFMAWWEAAEGRLDAVARWREANPGYGDILDAEELAGQARRALVGGMSESEFRIKRLNQWVAASTAALPAGLFERLASPRHLAPEEPIVLFFDGSFNHDCTALVACSFDGYLETVACWERPLDDPQWRVPIAEVDAVVRATCRDRTVIELACDPFRWAKEMEEWAAAGLPVIEYATSSPARMVPAWAKFYDAVLSGSLHHDGDPRLVRHMSNMILKIDRLGPRPVKEHRGSPRVIDLGICAVGAHDRAMFHATQAPVPPKPIPRFLSV